MKRLICLTLAILLMLSFAGCKKSSDLDSTNVRRPQQTEPDAQPAQSDAQGDQNNTQPVQNDAKPAQNDTKPVQNDAQPVQNDTKPVILTGNFTDSCIGLAFNLLKTVKKENSGKNIMVSPLSIASALAMTANGAEGNTLTQIESLLGCNVQDFNENSKSFFAGLGTQLKGANSAWFVDGNIEVYDEYINTLGSVYNADIKQVKHGPKAVADINNWVKDKTDGMIPSIIKELSPDAAAILINALAFDAKWEVPYEDGDVEEDTFFGLTEQKKANFMNSSENTYLETAMAKGFIRPYKDGKYSFIGLLPKTGYTVDYVAEYMTADEYKQMLKTASTETVNVRIPEFENKFSAELNNALTSLGVTDMFNSEAAKLTRIGKAKDTLYVGNVVHSTHISVNAEGTKAAAATIVNVETGAAPQDLPKYISLSKPFLYMIIENETNVPIFIGTVNDI